MFAFSVAPGLVAIIAPGSLLFARLAEPGQVSTYPVPGPKHLRTRPARGPGGPGPLIRLPYFRVCGSVEVFLSTATSLYMQALRHLKFKGLSAYTRTWSHNQFPGLSLRCALHHFSSLTRWNGAQDQVWPEHGRSRPKLKLQF